MIILSATLTVLHCVTLYRIGSDAGRRQFICSLTEQKKKYYLLYSLWNLCFHKALHPSYRGAIILYHPWYIDEYVHIRCISCNGPQLGYVHCSASTSGCSLRLFSRVVSFSMKIDLAIYAYTARKMLKFPRKPLT